MNNLFKFNDIWKLFIRPYRSEYTMNELGNFILNFYIPNKKNN